MGNKIPRRYSGFAQVCLLHEEVLVAAEPPTPQAHAYRLGEPTSDIHITDFRSTNPLVKPNVFDPPHDRARRPGYLVIRQQQTYLDIQIFDAPEKAGGPTLWLGFIDKERPPSRCLEWQALKLVGHGQGYKIAYAAFGS
jgi:hypothetical protein